ncbi:hypothetical protein [Arcanobacterium bovis]|uniref:Primosomal protein N' 3' DNA-binding domain-containing protein n=1 Tax=Arcanobacterium bovis TaxID=2529275 RepID=A0A4Q9V1D6_9ACTO|nr:hypothetical protein [Arcanobacterium bovis]TBW22920.1 hypothetical protein EZJ44_03220 [Arcanobacterium bovis]
MDREELNVGEGQSLGLSELGRQEALLSILPESKLLKRDFENPVAQVVVDVPVLHMDRIFDYEIPQRFSDLQVGARVVVEIGARKVDGFVVGRSKYTAHMSQLRPIQRVVSNVPVLQPQILELARKVAHSHLASLNDVLRLAIPQRHARGEHDFFGIDEVPFPHWARPEIPEVLAYYEHSNQLELLGDRRIVALMHLLATHREMDVLEYAIKLMLNKNKSVLLVVPTPRQAHNLAQLISQCLPGEPVAVSTSEDSHEIRYKHFLAALYGKTRIFIGTRSAVWTPIANLGLMVMMDDLHAAYIEKRSPYVHARDVLMQRSEQEGASLLVLDHGPSIAMRATMDSQGYAISGTLKARRNMGAQILAANQFAFEGAPWSRMPDSVFKVIREGLEHGPVLVVVPQTGYLPLLACARCAEIPRCPDCDGNLEIPAPDSSLKCARCAKEFSEFTCASCGFTKMKPIRIGSHRTAQEIGKAFPRVSINLIGMNNHTQKVSAGAKIVVCTPGYEPTADNGFSAAVVLDSGYLLRSRKLESESSFLRTMARITTRVRTRRDGGKLLMVGDVSNELIDTIGKWDFEGWEDQTLVERQELLLPPASPWVEVRGIWEEIRVFLSLLRAWQRNEHRDSPPPLDSLLLGGITDLIPGIAIVGPNRIDQNTSQIFLRIAKGHEETAYQAIRTVLREGSVNGTVKGLHINTHPQL